MPWHVSDTVAEPAGCAILSLPRDGPAVGLMPRSSDSISLVPEAFKSVCTEGDSLCVPPASTTLSSLLPLAALSYVHPDRPVPGSHEKRGNAHMRSHNTSCREHGEGGSFASMDTHGAAASSEMPGEGMESPQRVPADVSPWRGAQRTLDSRGEGWIVKSFAPAHWKDIKWTRRPWKTSLRATQRHLRRAGELDPGA